MIWVGIFVAFILYLIYIVLRWCFSSSFLLILRFLVIFSEFDMGSKFGLEVIFFFLMFICISHYFFHYSIWDSLIFSIFSQCSSRINLTSNLILKQIFLFIVVDFSLGCLILVDKKLRLWKRIDTLKPLSCFVVSRR